MNGWSPADPRPLVVVCAGSAWDGVAGSDRMLASALTRYARVLWVDPPLSLTHWRPGYGFPGPKMSFVDDVVRLSSIVAPLHTRAGVHRTTPVLARAQVRWALRRLGERPYAVIDCRLGKMLGGWGPGVHNVFYGTDDFVAGARLMGLTEHRVAAYERYEVEHADLVVAVSPTLEQRWARMGASVLMVPNGVRADAYDDLDSVTPAPDADLPAPVACVMGYLSARIDIGLLEAVVEQGCSLLLIGPYDAAWEPRRFAALCARERVRWVGQRRYEELGAYLRRVDVGLTPYQPDAFNRAAFPLKTLEYLAAGLPAVSTDLPATRWLDTDLVRIASDPADFAKATWEVATDPGRGALVAARRAFAAEHSWDARAARIAEAIALPSAPPLQPHR